MRPGGRSVRGLTGAGAGARDEAAGASADTAVGAGRDPAPGAADPATGVASGPPVPAPFEYQPALDGLRALAVVAVLLYHGNATWARGGFLGVDAFFVLSGYLITSLLLIEHARQGRIALRAFWARRARRLLPALFAVLVAVAAYGAFLAPADQVRSIWADGISTLLYVQNWHQIFSHQSYFASGAPSPLRHAWSLAIEEQWYVVWPLLLGLLVALTRRRRLRLLVVVVALAGASALLMAVLHEPGTDPSRVYYGTDTRAQSLLVGSALAVLLYHRPAGWGLGAGARRALDGAALVALAAAVWAWSTTGSFSDWLYRGGFASMALLVAVVVAAAVAPGPGAVKYLLSRRPLVEVGLISYGLYLWHWPVYLVVTKGRTGLDGDRLLLARLGVSFGVALASYHLVERPFRFGGLGRRVGWSAVPAGAAVVVGALALGTTGLVLSLPPPEVPRAEVKLKSPADAAQARTLIGLANPPNVVRGVLLGDSVAGTLGRAQPSSPATAGVRVDPTGTVIACGIMTGPLRGEGLYSDQERCGLLERLWNQTVDIWRPNVVVLLTGAWEVFDREIGGEWVSFGSDAFRAALDRRLEAVYRAATRYGARLVILTTPCFDPPDTLSWGAERRDPDRIAWLNRQWRRFAAAHPDRVSVLDLEALVCPDGRYTDRIDGRVVRRSDGVHFTAEGSRYVWRWLAPRLRELAPPADRIDRDS